jgi:hypothetical protein
MEPSLTENRREPRFQIEAGATVELHNKGQIVKATTVNMSGCGVLLQFTAPLDLVVGDEVLCDFKLALEAGDPLPRWGLGTVVRVDNLRVAVDFRGGGWTVAKADSPADEESR